MHSYIAYVSEPAMLRFPYTESTYNNPQNLWCATMSLLCVP